METRQSEPFQSGLKASDLDTERMRMIFVTEESRPDEGLGENFCDSFDTEVENIEKDKEVSLGQVIATMHLIVDQIEEAKKDEETNKLRRFIPKAAYAVLPTKGLDEDQIASLKATLSILHSAEKHERQVTTN